MATLDRPIEGDLPASPMRYLRVTTSSGTSGQLFSVEVGDDTGVVRVDWTVLQAVSDTLLRGCVRHRDPRWSARHAQRRGRGGTVVVSGGGPTLVPELVEAALASPTAWPAVGPGCEELAVVHAIVESVGGSMRIECGEGTTSVSVVVPRATGRLDRSGRSGEPLRPPAGDSSPQERISCRRLPRLTGAASPRMQ